jgi:hypothetical protein
MPLHLQTHSARRAAHQPQPPANQFISEEQPNIAQQAKSTSGLPRNEGFPRGVVQQPQQDAFHAEDVPIEREHPNDYGALLSYVWRAITTRLHDNNVSAKSLNASQFSFLLPTDATQNADLWEKLLWSPLTLTPAELNSIIRLDTSIPRTKSCFDQARYRQHSLLSENILFVGGTVPRDLKIHIPGRQKSCFRATLTLEAPNQLAHVRRYRLLSLCWANNRLPHCSSSP